MQQYNCARTKLFHMFGRRYHPLLLAPGITNGVKVECGGSQHLRCFLSNTLQEQPAVQQEGRTCVKISVAAARLPLVVTASAISASAKRWPWDSRHASAPTGAARGSKLC